MHTNFEKMITSGEWCFSYICYALLFLKKNRDMKQTWQNFNICLILWVSTGVFYYVWLAS